MGIKLRLKTVINGDGGKPVYRKRHLEQKATVFHQKDQENSFLTQQGGVNFTGGRAVGDLRKDTLLKKAKDRRLPREVSRE